MAAGEAALRQPGPVPGDSRGRLANLRGRMSVAGSRGGQVGIGLVVAIVAFSFLGPLVYHTNQVTVQLGLATLPPGTRSARTPPGMTLSGG